MVASQGKWSLPFSKLLPIHLNDGRKQVFLFHSISKQAKNTCFHFSKLQNFVNPSFRAPLRETVQEKLGKRECMAGWWWKCTAPPPPNSSTTERVGMHSLSLARPHSSFPPCCIAVSENNLLDTLQYGNSVWCSQSNA